MAHPRFNAGAMLLVAFGFVASGATNAFASSERTVTMESMTFTPGIVTVNAGDTITWVNKDIVAHTATSPAGGFDSGSIDINGSWKFTAKKKGTFAYTCSFHPTMKGTLVVK